MDGDVVHGVWREFEQPWLDDHGEWVGLPGQSGLWRLTHELTVDDTKNGHASAYLGGHIDPDAVARHILWRWGHLDGPKFTGGELVASQLLPLDLLCRPREERRRGTGARCRAQDRGPPDYGRQEPPIP